MTKIPMFAVVVALLLGSSSHAFSQEKPQDTAASATEQSSGVKNLRGYDSARIAAIAAQIRAGRQNYTCDSVKNECTCWPGLDCALAIIEECRSPPVNPDGSLCGTGSAPCTCKWH